MPVATNTSNLGGHPSMNSLRGFREAGHLFCGINDYSADWSTSSMMDLVLEFSVF